MIWQLLIKPRGLTEKAQQLVHGSDKQQYGRVILPGEVLPLHMHIRSGQHFTEQIAHFDGGWQIVLFDEAGRMVPESIPPV